LGYSLPISEVKAIPALVLFNPKGCSKKTYEKIKENGTVKVLGWTR
jgi:hypothetical protein